MTIKKNYHLKVSREHKAAQQQRQQQQQHTHNHSSQMAKQTTGSATGNKNTTIIAIEQQMFRKRTAEWAKKREHNEK